MIGRAALANPWIFSLIKSKMRGEVDEFPVVSPKQRWDVIIRLSELTLQEHASGLGERDIRWMLGRLHPLTHGLPSSRKVRESLRHCRTLDDLRRLRDEHQREHAESYSP